METYASPFAYIAAISTLGLTVPVFVHFAGWFWAPERITPFFTPD